MDNRIELRRQVLGHPILVTAIPAGRDWSVTVLGGCAPHVGSVSLAEYQGKETAAVLRTLTRASHKDQIIGERFALRLAERCQCAVCVSCGIHFDGPTKADLTAIVACAEALLEQLCQDIEAQALP